MKAAVRQSDDMFTDMFGEKCLVWCVCVCVRARVCVCVRACVHTHMYVCVHVRTVV